MRLYGYYDIQLGEVSPENVDVIHRFYYQNHTDKPPYWDGEKFFYPTAMRIVTSSNLWPSAENYQHIDISGGKCVEKIIFIAFILSVQAF